MEEFDWGFSLDNPDELEDFKEVVEEIEGRIVNVVHESNPLASFYALARVISRIVVCDEVSDTIARRDFQACYKKILNLPNEISTNGETI